MTVQGLAHPLNELEVVLLGSALSARRIKDITLQLLQEDRVLVVEEANLETQTQLLSLDIVQRQRDRTELLCVSLHRLKARVRHWCITTIFVFFLSVRPVWRRICVVSEQLASVIVQLRACVVAPAKNSAVFLPCSALLELLSHRVEQSHQVVIVRLLLQLRLLAIVFVVRTPLTFQGQVLVVALVQPVDIFQCRCQRCRHSLIQILVVALSLLEPVLDELISARLVDVVLEPWKVEFVHAETYEIEE